MINQAKWSQLGVRILLIAAVAVLMVSLPGQGHGFVRQQAPEAPQKKEQTEADKSREQQEKVQNLIKELLSDFEAGKGKTSQERFEEQRRRVDQELEKTQRLYEQYKINSEANKQAQLRRVEEQRKEVERLSRLTTTQRDEIKRLAAELDAKRDALTETVADLRVARERLANMEPAPPVKPK